MHQGEVWRDKYDYIKFPSPAVAPAAFAKPAPAPRTPAAQGGKPRKTGRASRAAAGDYDGQTPADGDGFQSTLYAQTFWFWFSAFGDYWFLGLLVFPVPPRPSLVIGAWCPPTLSGLKI